MKSGVGNGLIGVNNNQAESFFAHMLWMVIGQAHRVTPKYMYEYMSEIA